MSKLRIFWNIFILIFLLGGVWAIFVVTRTFQIEQPQSNIHLIPESADAVIYLNGNALIGKTISDIALTAQDEELFDMILRHIEERAGTEVDDVSPGINLNSGIVLFAASHEEIIYYGALFNLIDGKLFDDHISSFLNENQFSGRKNEVGYILSSINPVVDKKWLAARSRSLFDKCSSHLTQEINESQAPILYWYKDATTNQLSSISVNLDNHAILLEGDIQFSQSLNSPRNKLKAKGLHVSSSTVPHLINDSLRTYFKNQLPPLSSFSINYFGSQLIESGSMGLIPKSDLLLTFKEPIEIGNILDSLNIIAEKASENQFFMVGDKRMFYHQLSTHTVYLGEHIYNDSLLTKTDYAVEMEGDLSLLMLVKGSSIMVKFLEILPIYSATKRFTKNIESFDIRVAPQGEKNLQGDIVFTDNHYPLNELVRWLLEGKLIE